MGRRISDRTLRRWLATGKPRRVERVLASDAALEARLDELTRLAPAEVAALEQITSPAPQFEERIRVGVQDRRDADGTASLVADLIGLGIHMGSVMVDPLGEDDREPEVDG